MRIDNVPPIETVRSEKEYAERLTRSISSCSYFVDQFIDFDTFDYNRAFLDCEDRFIAYRTGRQVGKSTNLALKAIHFGYFAPLKASNLGEGVANVVIASLSKDQAALIFEKITNFVHKSPTLTKCITRETRTQLSIRWFDGSGTTNFVVRPIGDTGESLRGYTSHMVILDEAAYIPEAVYTSFMPSAMTTRAIILITSTPKGKAGFFFKACTKSRRFFQKGREVSESDWISDKDDAIWTQFHVTSYDNPLSASDPALMNLVKSMSAETAQNEIYGEFIEGGNALIPFALLQESLREPEPLPAFEYYDLGVDTSGKGKDETVLMTFGITPDGVAYAVDAYTEMTTDQTLLAGKIDGLDRRYHYRNIIVDSTGMGDALIDILRQRNQSLPVVPVNFKQDKTDIYVNLSLHFVERTVNLSLLEARHRDKTADQLSYMYWYYGEYKDQAPKARTEHADDYADAAALGVWGLQNREYIQDVPMGFWN